MRRGANVALHHEPAAVVSGDECGVAGFCLALKLFDIAELSESLAIAFDGGVAEINSAGGLSIGHASLEAAVFCFDGIEVPEGDILEDHVAESLIDFGELLFLGFFKLEPLELVAWIELWDVGCGTLAIVMGWFSDTGGAIAV